MMNYKQALERAIERFKLLHTMFGYEEDLRCLNELSSVLAELYKCEPYAYTDGLIYKRYFV